MARNLANRSDVCTANVSGGAAPANPIRSERGERSSDARAIGHGAPVPVGVPASGPNEPPRGDSLKPPPQETEATTATAAAAMISAGFMTFLPDTPRKNSRRNIEK